MKAVSSLIPTVSSDEFGICSALYELGGMIVMHDASGCNSTYTTHDEPRWYDRESLIFISAISEMEAIMGDDEKLIRDVIDAAREYHPKFIALVGAPIPYMIGTDLEAIARILEDELKIPCFGLPANGMHSYQKGISMAMTAIADRFCIASGKRPEDLSEKLSGKKKVNVLGATPLDFSMNGSVRSIHDWIEELGMETNCVFCMDSTLEEIADAGMADVSLVVSEGGLKTAELLEQRFGIPYVVGIPVGTKLPIILGNALKEAIDTKKTCSVFKEAILLEDDRTAEKQPDSTVDSYYKKAVILAEPVMASSLAYECFLHSGMQVIAATATAEVSELVLNKNAVLYEEDDLMDFLKDADFVAADPLYKVLINEETGFFSLPHMGVSGRIYEKEIKNYINREIDLC